MPMTGVSLHSNKILAAKEEERNQRLHRMKLLTIRPSIDNKPPQKHPHVVHNRKRAQYEEERLAEIEKQNGQLLEKLSLIAGKHGAMGKPHPHGHGARALLKGEATEPRSLHDTARRKEFDRIAAENAAILKRIQASQEKASSSVDPRVLAEQWKEKEKYRKLASHL